MTDFKAKIHQMHFLLGIHPRPAAGALYSIEPLDL